jgi:NTE family protein
MLGVNQMKIGLALSGGAARGIAHIGVLKYLEERDVQPCCIAGTSAGSIVGAFYCSGMSVTEITALIEKLSWKDLVKISLPRKGLIDSTRLLKIIKDGIGTITFADLKIPLLINAVDLLSGEEIILEKGLVAEAVQASCAIPGIFTPVKFEDKLLVDGGLLDNVPVALMKNREIDFIIAVDVGAQKPLRSEPENIFEVLIQSYDIIRRHRDKPAYEHSDSLIEPELGDISFWDNSKVNHIIDRGYEAAEKVLSEVSFTKKKWSISGWFGRRKQKKR